MNALAVSVGTVARVRLWGGAYLAVMRSDGWHFTQGDGKWEDPLPFPDKVVEFEVLSGDAAKHT